MTLLASVNYDPAGAINQVCTSRLAMTKFSVFDSSFPVLSFTTPSVTYDGSNAAVLVKMHGVVHGATTMPQVFLGLRDASNIIARVIPIIGIKNTAVAANLNALDATFIVPLLAPNSAKTWEVAYGVDILAAATGIKYGGPNNTTVNDAFGGFSCEIHDVPNLINAILYDPAALQTNATVTAAKVMTKVDAGSALDINFNVPASGNVQVFMHGTVMRGFPVAQVFLGCLEGSTLRGRHAPSGGMFDTTGVANREPQQVEYCVTGLTPAANLTWSAAYGVETVGSAGSIISMGGPDNTTTDDAAGAFGFALLAV